MSLEWGADESPNLTISVGVGQRIVGGIQKFKTKLKCKITTFSLSSVRCTSNMDRLILYKVSKTKSEFGNWRSGGSRQAPGPGSATRKDSGVSVINPNLKSQPESLSHESLSVTRHESQSR